MSEPHASYEIRHSHVYPGEEIAVVKFIGSDGRKYGAYLSPDTSILEDQEMLDAYMLSVVRKVQRDEQA